MSSSDDDNEDDDDDNNEDDDLIELTGQNRVTKWRFPKDLTCCPYRLCRKQFQTRAKAMNHYKAEHAGYSILCSVCNSPVSAKSINEFNRHIRRHREKGETVDNKVDDVIELSGCFRSTYWRFPKEMTRCPNQRCRLKSFKTRADAIAHFKAEHASNNILCSHCNKPIYVKYNASKLKRHYESIHPDKSFERDYKAIPMSNVQQNPPSGRGFVKAFEQHSKETKSLNRIVCPLKHCDFVTNRSNELRSHWTQMHSHLEFPEIDDASNFAFTVTQSNRVQQTLDSIIGKYVGQKGKKRPNTLTPNFDVNSYNLKRSVSTSSEKSSSEDNGSSHQVI